MPLNFAERQAFGEAEFVRRRTNVILLGTPDRRYHVEGKFWIRLTLFLGGLLGLHPSLQDEQLGSIWVALNGSWGFHDGTFPCPLLQLFAGQGELWPVAGAGKKQSQPWQGELPLHVNAKELLASTYGFSHLVDEGHIPHPLHFCLTQSEGKKSNLNEAV